MNDRITVRSSLWATGLFCLALLLVYHDTVWSMVYIWSRSETFAHGYLILPISLWLVWTHRDSLIGINPKPAWWVGLLIIPLSLGWLLAWLVDVTVVQQLALVAMLIAGAWAILGHKLGSVLAFPLFFLFFAVPIGEGLVAPMMEFTATSTVWMVQMTGIPVFREGLYFTLPTGNWSVVEACSGVRYIIASITVGVLYAYLTYRSWTRRLLFVLVSAIVPIFANTARAYIIVMLGHLSDMTIATGADHLVYGWVFFGVVIFVLFWVGGFFREDQFDPTPAQRLASARQDGPAATYGTLLATLFSTLLLTAIVPMLVSAKLDNTAFAARNSLSLPAAQNAWRSASERPWLWNPPSKVSGQQSAYFQGDGEIVGLMVQFADGTIEGADVIGSSALFTKEDSGWRVVSQQKATVRLPDGDVSVDEAQLHGAHEELLAWSWYVMGDSSTSNDYVAKLQQAMSRVGLRAPGAYRIIVVTTVQLPPEPARARLQDFVREYAPGVYGNLRHPVPTAQ